MVIGRRQLVMLECLVLGLLSVWAVCLLGAARAVALYQSRTLEGRQPLPIGLGAFVRSFVGSFSQSAGSSKKERLMARWVCGAQLRVLEFGL